MGRVNGDGPARVAAALAQVVTDHGVDVGEDPRRLRALLADALGSTSRSHEREIAALVAASAAGTPARHLREGVTAGAQADEAGTLTREGIDEQTARWAVTTWDRALAELSGGNVPSPTRVPATMLPEAAGEVPVGGGGSPSGHDHGTWSGGEDRRRFGMPVAVAAAVALVVTVGGALALGGDARDATDAGSPGGPRPGASATAPEVGDQDPSGRPGQEATDTAAIAGEETPPPVVAGTLSEVVDVRTWEGWDWSGWDDVVYTAPDIDAWNAQSVLTGEGGARTANEPGFAVGVFTDQVELAHATVTFEQVGPAEAAQIVDAFDAPENCHAPQTFPVEPGDFAGAVGALTGRHVFFSCGGASYSAGVLYDPGDPWYVIVWEAYDVDGQPSGAQLLTSLTVHDDRIALRVPSLVGMTEDEAVEAFIEFSFVHNLDYSLVTIRQPSSTAPAGTVIEQRPPAGTEVRRGDGLEPAIVVSDGAAG